MLQRSKGAKAISFCNTNFLLHHPEFKNNPITEWRPSALF